MQYEAVVEMVQADGESTEGVLGEVDIPDTAIGVSTELAASYPHVFCVTYLVPNEESDRERPSADGEDIPSSVDPDASAKAVSENAQFESEGNQTRRG